MTTTAAFGWGSSHLNTTPAGEVDLDPAERLAVQQTLARYAFALDHGDLVTLAGRPDRGRHLGGLDRR